MEQYYTLTIKYLNIEKNEIRTEIRKDLTPPDSTTESAWRFNVRKFLFTSGFEVQTSPTAWEFISPLVIQEVFLIQQDKKYGI